MTSLTFPAAQVCAFALGCALIHAARAHAATVTRLLTGAAALAAALLLFAATLACPPDDDVVMSDITIFNGA